MGRSRSCAVVRRPVVGVTLVELLVVIVIISLVAAGISRLLGSSWDSEYTVTNQNDVQQQATSAADAVVDSLRGAAGVVSGTTAEITARFANSNTVRYYRVGGELRRDRYNAATGVTTAGEVIGRSCEALQFAYLRRQANALVAAAPTAAESLTISVRVAREGYAATETSSVRLRNKY